MDNSDSGNVEQGNTNAVERPSNSVGFFKLFAFADKFDRMLMIVGSLSAIIAGLPLPLLTYLFGDVFDVLGGQGVPAHILLHKITVVMLKSFLVAGVTSIALFTDVACWRVTAERQTTRMRHIYLSSLLLQDISFFDTQISSGEMIETISADILNIREVIGTKAGKMFQLCATFLSGFVIAFIRGWRLTVVVVATVPLIVAVAAIGPFLCSRISKKLNASNTEVGNIVGQAISAIRTVVSFGGEKKAVDSSKTAMAKLYRVSLQLGMASGFGHGLMLGGTFSVYALTLWYGAWIVIHNGFSGGRVITVLFAILAGGGALGQAFPCFSAFTAAKTEAARVFKVIECVPEMDRSKEKGVVPEGVTGNIEFQNVSFWYPSRPDVKILERFSLVIQPGETVALVGESGSGKSTLVSLLERFYDPQIGSIFLDSIEIKDIQIQWLRQQIGLVSQEPVLFGASIKDNIGFGEHTATLQEIQKAAKLANVKEFIESLPEGYDTMVGDRGAQLSGGQKQRIAIARAILKNPRILLLDEATSALDTGSERAVQEALEKVMVERTTVVIAHRLSTIRNAQSICVLKKGKLIEQGTHAELIQRRDGAYTQMVKQQELQEEEEEADESESDRENIVEDFLEANIFGRNGSFIGRSSRHLSFRSESRNISRDGSSIKRNSRHSSFRSLSSVGLTEEDNLKSLEESMNLHTNMQRSIFKLAPLNRHELPVLLFGSLAASASGTILPLFGLLLANVISSFYEEKSKLKKDSIFWSLMFLLLAFAAFIVNPIQISCFTHSGSKLVHRLRIMTLQHAMRQEMAWFDKYETSSGVISSRISTHCASIKSLVKDGLSLMIQNAATITSGLFIAFLSSWHMAFVLISLLVLIVFQSWGQLKMVKKFSAKSQMAEAEPVHVAIDALSNIRTIASFCAEDHVLQMHAQQCKEPMSCATQLAIIDGIGFGVINFVLFATYGFSFWVGAQLVIHRLTNHTQIFRVFFAFTLSAISISEAVQMLPDISRVKVAVNSLFSIIERKSQIDPEDLTGKTLPEMKGEITFKHVYFKYPTRPRVQILKDFNLHLDPGKSVALVGESGSGKSTVLSLLERFYDSNRGLILLDKTDIKTLQLKWLRRQMALVGQEPILFDESIRDNIAYGRQGEESAVSEEEIVTAAKISNAHTFISSLPDGYNTRVGERGTQLSGGQKQRISIARAMVRNPRILLLDEATSALDVESEQLVQEALNRAIGGRSTIMVAHRLSTIRGADSIAVIRGGRVVEQGSHSFLLSMPNGIYATLVKSSLS
ncbi:ABC transporter B family member 3 isoform X2 [Cryptomeria japonica]|uniref:ABC transporter B family member 3 isoform X2 n=1 Tax=Cryptomeria japonica TaxID=3369 RepID=UPI0027DA6C76|nr:ABC transporter B family member 3 isoform X2 [Cryptomeria japonica]